MKTGSVVGRKSEWISIFSALSVVLIFLYDLSTPLGRAEWLLYLIPLIVASYVLSVTRLMLLTLVCSALVLAGFFASDHNLPYSRVALFNRILVIGVFWVVARVMSSRKEALAELAKTRDELEVRVEERTAELSEANRELNEEAEKRKALERERTDFLAMVSHDMKSPLTVITGYAELMLKNRRESLDPDTLSMVEGIDSSSRRLMRLFEDFVALSKLESGKIKPNRYVLTVSAGLSETVKAFSVIAQEKGLDYSWRLPDAPLRAELDWAFVQRAVCNLVENAMNYTPAGGRVEFAAQEEDGELVIEVSDTGPGVAPQERERIFEKYYRSQRTCRTKGTGLGLATVKAVAESHGGRVELESEVGKGSVFRMRFPKSVVATPPVDLKAAG